MTQLPADLAEAIAHTTPAMRAQVGAVAIVATLALLPIAWLGVVRLVPGRNIVFARWGFSHVVLALILMVAASYALSLLPLGERSLGVDLALSGGAFGVVVVAICAWAVRLDPDGVRVLGLRAQGAGRALLAAVLTFVAAFPGYVGAVQLWSWLLGVCGHVAEPQEVAARFAALPPDERALPLVLGIVVQPLFEEVVFRSFLQPLLVQNFREIMGVGLTSLLFGALHGVDAFLPIFALSCVLGAIMLRTRSLYAVWFVHALNNGLQFALLYAHPEMAKVGAGP